MRHVATWVLAAVAVTVAGSAVRAESLADVRKKIESQAHKHQSLRQQVRMTMDLGGPAGKMTAESTMEFVRRGPDKWVTRSDMQMRMPGGDGQTGGEQTRTTVIYDGQFVYAVTSQGGQTFAMKMKPDQGQQKAMTEPTGFAEIEKQYDLKLLPDQKVAGKDTWVIEAKRKKGPARPDEFDRMVMQYDKTTGALAKTTSYDRAGKPVATMEVVKVETDVKIPDERFQVPPGVQVMDMTGGMPRIPLPDDGQSDAGAEE